MFRWLVAVQPFFALAASPISAWIEGLTEEGFVVQEGDYGFYDLETCKEADTCYAINPLTPYGLSWLPPHPEEASSEVDYENSCVKHNICRGNTTSPWGVSWRIAKGEVVVIAGKSPPESVYWSFSPTMFSRYHEPLFVPRPQDLSKAIISCPPALLKGNRCEVFSGINDPVNHLSANFSGGSPFAEDFALVVAWDKVSEQKAVAELQSAGQGNVNVLRMPGAVGELGVTAGTEDEWMTILRVEGIVNATLAKEFYAGSPFRTFRVTPPKDFSVPDEALFPSFDGHMRQRVTGQGEGAEDASFQDLQTALDKLQDAVIEREHHRFGSRRLVANVPFDTFVNDSGYECLSHGTKCQGDCRDTIYAKATHLIRQLECEALPLPDVGACNEAWTALLSEEAGDAIFAIGVNHKKLKHSLYSSVTAYDFPKLAAVSPGVTDDMYDGTAVQYLGEEDPAAKYLYVVKFARSCDSDEDLCIEIPTESDDPTVSALALDKPVVFLQRMYINPKTGSGPAVSESILGNLIHFKPRSSVRTLV